jgi:hypothetical protein
MSTISQLMDNLSPESEFVRGLITITTDCEGEEEENISNVFQQAITSKPSLHYPLLDELISDNTNTTSEKCHAAIQLTSSPFSDSNSFDYFVLTPVPDGNAAEEFAASMAFRNNKTMGM